MILAEVSIFVFMTFEIYSLCHMGCKEEAFFNKLKGNKKFLIFIRNEKYVSSIRH
jgi:hypothetical protein